MAVRRVAAVFRALDHVSLLAAEAERLRSVMRIAMRMAEREAAEQRNRPQQVTQGPERLERADESNRPQNISQATDSQTDAQHEQQTMPALYATDGSGFGPGTFQVVENETPADAQDPARETADTIVEDVAEGKSLDVIAEERGLEDREAVVAALEAGGYAVEVTEPTSDTGDVQTTTISPGPETQDTGTGPEPGAGTDAQDPEGSEPTVTEYYDYHNDTYYTTVEENGEETTTPVRNPDGWTVEETYDPDSGVTQTRLEDDLGDGTVSERTERPGGVTVETTTDPNGDTETAVTSDGTRTVLADDQEPTKEGSEDILDEVIAGKSVEEIAEARGLTPAQVRAQLEGAGYTVEISEATSDIDDVVRTVLDDNGTVVAGYHYDDDQDVTTVTYVDDDGNAVERTEHADGRVSETTTDPDGRETTTITEPTDGEEDGTSTTIQETYNGHTLTTAPDGSMELENHETGITIEIESGSMEEALARTLLEANPESSDPAEAQEGEIVVNVIEGLLAGKSYDQALSEVEAAQEEKQEALDQYGLGPEATPVVDTDENGNQTINFQGEPPVGQAPSGGDWVPMKVDGSWHWVDPEVAQAIAAEAIAIGQLNEVQAAFDAGQAQFDVYALDPAYADAMDAAQGTLDEALAPHGLAWVRPEPEGTLAEAQTRLTDANEGLTAASGAVEAYEEAQELLDQAITQQENMPFYPDGTTPVASSPDSDYNYEEEFRKGEAARAEVTGLFYGADAKRTEGDTLTADYTVGALEGQFNAGRDQGFVDAPQLPEGSEPVEITVGDETLQVMPEVAERYEEIGIDALPAGGEPIRIQIDTNGDGTLEWQWVTPDLAATWLDLQGARALREGLGQQLEIAQAYTDFYAAQTALAQRQRQAGEVRDELYARFRDERPYLFEDIGEKKHRTVGGDYLGPVTDIQVVEDPEDHQLYVEVTFEEGENRFPLTYAAGDRNAPDEVAEDPLNQRWQDLVNGTIDEMNCSNDGLSGLKAAELSAGRHLNETLEAQLDVTLEDLDAQIGDLQARHDGLLEDFDLSGVEPLQLPEGVEPVTIEVGGAQIEVAPEVAEAYPQQGLAALTAAGLPVRMTIDIDGDGIEEQRWVDPELAVVRLELTQAEGLRETIETARQATEAAANWYGFQLSEPLKLMEDAGSAEHLATLQDTYLEEHERQMLDERIQPQVRSLYENGYDGTFRPFTEENITEALNLDTSSTEGRETADGIVDRVIDEIRDIGGEDAEIRVVPIFYVDDTVGVQQSALFAVKNEDGETRYVDATGKAFDGIEDFQDNNDQFGEDGRLVVPVELQMRPGADGSIPLEVVQARNVSTWDKVADPLIAIGTGLAGLAALIPTPASPFLAGVAYTGAAYFAGKSVINQANHLNHGGEWGDSQSWMNMGMLATTVLPGGASLFRAGGMAGRTLATGSRITFGRALLASAGMAKPGTPLANAAGAYMASPALANRLARGLDWSAIGTGVPLMATSLHDIALHGDDMNGLELASNLIGLGTGLAGTALAAQGLRMTRPNTTTTAASPLPAGTIIRMPGSVTDGPDILPATESGPDISRPLQDRDSEYRGASRAPEETPFRRFDVEDLHENPWLPPERAGGEAAPPSGDNRFWTWVQGHVPDVRGGGQIRFRANTDILTEGAAQAAGVPTERPEGENGSTTENFQIGNPTVASTGFAFSTKMNIWRIWRGRAESVTYGPDAQKPSLRERIGREVTTSVRPHEYQNMTLSQFGAWPTSNQTVFQMKGSRLLGIGNDVLFGDAAGSPFVVMPRSAKVIGKAPDGSGWVVELSYSPMLSTGKGFSQLPAGRREFFGASPDNPAGFIELPGPLAYDKIMEEFKLQVRPRILASNVPLIDKLIPRLGFERRPEVAFAATLPEGSIVSRQFYEQNQTLLARTDLRVQFVVRELGYANHIASDPRLSEIRALANSGIINPDAVASYVPGIRSGLRLSAIPGKTSEARFRSLTGDERWVWDPSQTNLDVTLNDYYPLFGRSVQNPDALRARLGPRANFGLPQGAYIPSDGNVFRGIFGQKNIFGTPATRYTVSLSSPYYTLGVPGVKVLQLPWSVSFEGRLQYKRDAPSTAPATARTNWTHHTTTNSDGLPLELAVPGWLDTAISWPSDVSHVLVPKGARESMTGFLTDLESSAMPTQRAEIDVFRESILPQIKDNTFVPRETFGEIAKFLDGQLRPASHLPPPDLSYFAGPELKASLESWYTQHGADSPPPRETPFRRFDAEDLHENTWRPSESPPRSDDPGVPARSDDVGELPPATDSRSYPWIAPAIIATVTGGIAFHSAMAEDGPTLEGAPSILNLADGPIDVPLSTLFGETDASPVEFAGSDPSQMVVWPADGLPLRESPDPQAPGQAHLRHGSFVSRTGQQQRDADGNVWLRVHGRGADGSGHTGWVLADQVEAHPQGAMEGSGRVNPLLERIGYHWVDAREGDSIRRIAVDNGADVVETVTLNMDHIVQPHRIYAGDRIYLPMPGLSAGQYGQIVEIA